MAAQCSLAEAANHSEGTNANKVNELQSRMTETIFKECEEMSEHFTKLNQILNEANYFQRLEREFRANVNQLIMKNKYYGFN